MDEMMLHQNARKLKIRANALKLFQEAHRRRGIGGEDSGRTIDKSWVGLGTPSTYRPGIEAGYFRPHRGQETPRVLNWYLFTAEGIEAYKALYGDTARVEPYRGLPMDGGSGFELMRAI